MKPDAEARDRAAEILAAWHEEQANGSAIDAEELVRRHPDVADALREAIALSSLVDAAFAAVPTGVAGSRGETSTSASGVSPIPERIGDYRIVREIARGGMGIVYEAEQVSMRRRVALKILFPGIIANPKAVQRFQREAQAAGRLHHTNIVPVYGMGNEGATWYYAMELVEGRVLHRILADLRRLEGVPGGPPRPPDGDESTWVGATTGHQEEFKRIARAFSGVADALAAAHAAGVIHRDVKPSNLVLDAAGTLKILDFGLARCLAEDPGLTVTGELVGTPAYMSPEQARAGRVGAGSDVYSLGATLYEVLTRRPPFHGKDVGDVLRKVVSEEPSPPRRLDRRIPRDLETIVVKAMEKDPVRRYATAAEFAHDLLLFAEGAAIQARRVGTMRRIGRRIRTHKARTAFLGACVAMTALGALLLVEHAHERRRQRTEDYDRLLDELHEHAFLTTVRGTRFPGSPDSEAPKESEALIARLVAIDVTRPEAYLFRAMLPSTPAASALADLEHASALGLAPRTTHLARARIFHDAGRLEDAANESRAASSCAPCDDDETLVASSLESLLRADLSLQGDDLPVAVADLARWIEHGGARTRAGAQLARARLRQARGDVAGAIEDLAAARIPGAHRSSQISIQMASLWRQLGNLAQAESLVSEAVATARSGGSEGDWAMVCAAMCECEEVAWLDAATAEALQRHPQSAKLLVYRASALEFRDPRAALAAVDEAIGLAPAAPVAWAVKADIAGYGGDLRVAVAAWEKASSLEPRWADYLAGLGCARVLAGKTVEGLADLARAKQMDPRSHAVFEKLAFALASLQRPAALDAADRAIELEPHCVWCRDVRAQTLLTLGRFEDALAESDRATRRSPQYGDLFVTKALALRLLGRLDDALRACDEADRLAPRSAKSRFVRGDVLCGQGHTEEALLAYRRGLEIEPGDVLARRIFVELLTRSERFEEALAACERLLADVGSVLELPQSRIELLILLGRYDDALHACEVESARGGWDDSNLAFEVVALFRAGRSQDTLDRARVRTEKSPETFANWGLQVEILIAMGRPGEAVELAHQASARFAGAEQFVELEVNALRRAGRRTDARDLARKTLERGGAPRNRAALLAAADMPAEARAALGQPPVPDDYERARVLAMIGDVEGALVALSHAVEIKGMRLLGLSPTTDFDSLRGDPRFPPLERKLFHFPAKSR